MKRVLAIAALLMVGCGSNQSGNTTEETPKIKVSEKRVYGDKQELKVVLPKTAPADIQVITADKDMDFIQNKTVITVSEE